MKAPVTTAAALGGIVCCLLPACSRPLERTPADPATYEFAVTDEPSLLQFRLQLTSKSDVTLCIANESWPNSVGKVGAAHEGIKLRWSGGEAFAMHGMEEYCPKGCYTIVPPRASVTGVVKYAEFGDPEWVLSLEDRTLDVRMSASRCR